MGKKHPGVDAYIERSANFAQPILTRLREVVHAACPDVEETLKWSAPAFMYHGMLCSMAAFKQHCAFGFWKGALVTGNVPKATSAMGDFGRITKLSDLPPKRVIAAYVKKAMTLNEEGSRAPRPDKHRKPALAMPPDFDAALRKHRKARATFEAFSQSHRREYIEWIVEAKREETRKRRIATALEWLGEGRSRNWKYQ